MQKPTRVQTSFEGIGPKLRNPFSKAEMQLRAAEDRAILDPDVEDWLKTEVDPRLKIDFDLSLTTPVVVPRSVITEENSVTPVNAIWPFTSHTEQALYDMEEQRKIKGHEQHLKGQRKAQEQYLQDEKERKHRQDWEMLGHKAYVKNLFDDSFDASEVIPRLPEEKPTKKPETRLLNRFWHKAKRIFKV